jgi:hypothetical protein
MQSGIDLMYSENDSLRKIFKKSDSIEDLYSHGGRDFIAAAYLTMLGRCPEPHGEAYYYGRLCMGYARIEILNQIACSNEYDPTRHHVSGLSSALKRYRRSRTPILGWLYRLFSGSEGYSRRHRRERAFMNEIATIRSDIAQMSRSFETFITLPASQNVGMSGQPLQQATPIEPTPTVAADHVSVQPFDHGVAASAAHNDDLGDMGSRARHVFKLLKSN